MDNKATTCEIISASERVSEWKKSFICANDDLHQAMLESPLAIFVYAFGVILIMFLVQHASRPNPYALKKKPKLKTKDKERKNENG
jgi:hypothetical protein